jgi:hypothetical protein
MHRRRQPSSTGAGAADFSMFSSCWLQALDWQRLHVVWAFRPLCIVLVSSTGGSGHAEPVMLGCCCHPLTLFSVVSSSEYARLHESSSRPAMQRQCNRNLTTKLSMISHRPPTICSRHPQAAGRA